jgi:uncharacterized damage-inducible protein DinB
MSKPLLRVAFAHHVWATQRLIDSCATLSPEQLATSVPGTFGSILDTFRHLVGSDAWYLLALTGDRALAIDEDHMALVELRAAIGLDGTGWAALLTKDLDPDEVVADPDPDEDGWGTVGIRLAQALHHGTDHRSQICTALTTLGMEPPGIDVWDFGDQATAAEGATS